MLWSAPPEVLAAVIRELAVSFRWADWTARLPMPLTEKRRKVCLTGEPRIQSPVWVPSLVVATDAST